MCQSNSATLSKWDRVVARMEALPSSWQARLMHIPDRASLAHQYVWLSCLCSSRNCHYQSQQHPHALDLQTVMARFAKAEDPLMEGHSLLELYQAQYVSALR